MLRMFNVSNLRTTAFSYVAPDKNLKSKRGCTPAPSPHIGSTKYYDVESKIHLYLKASEADFFRQVAKRTLISCAGLAGKTAREEKSRNPSKSRKGEANGRYGQTSTSKGKKWYTIDGKELLLSSEEAAQQKKTALKFVVGRKLFVKGAQNKNSLRARGRRVIFEGELSGRYRVFPDVQGENAKRKYQFGWTWNPSKPTYRNGKLI